LLGLFELSAHSIFCSKCLRTVYSVRIVCAQYILFELSAHSIFCSNCLRTVYSVRNVCAQYILFELSAHSIFCSKCLRTVYPVRNVCAQYILFQLSAHSIFCSNWLRTVYYVRTVCAQYILFELSAHSIFSSNCLRTVYSIWLPWKFSFPGVFPFTLMPMFAGHQQDLGVRFSILFVFSVYRVPRVAEVIAFCVYARFYKILFHVTRCVFYVVYLLYFKKR
jgi:hypothetical protein